MHLQDFIEANAYCQPTEINNGAVIGQYSGSTVSLALALYRFRACIQPDISDPIVYLVCSDDAVFVQYDEQEHRYELSSCVETPYVDNARFGQGIH